MTSGCSHSDSKRVSLSSTLPFEIWHSISHFLPEDQLRELYSVNRALFHIAMPLRYYEVSLSGPGELMGIGNSQNQTKILETPSLAKYVRKLTFHVICYGRIHDIDKPPQNKTLATFSSFLHTSRGRRIRKFKAQAQKNKALIVLLDQLTTLTISWHCCHADKLFFESYVEMITAGWSTFGSTIRNLSLDIALQSIPFLLATPFHLPQLANLDLCIQNYASTDVDISLIRSNVAPLITSHSGTITTLSAQLSSSVNHTTFYTIISHLPNLQIFKLKETYSGWSIHNHALSVFLRLHSESLTEIDWELSSEPGWPNALTQDTFTQAPFDVYLPKLKKLRIGFAMFWMKLLGDFQDIFVYIGRHSHTLVSLSIDGRSLSTPEFHGLLNGTPLPQLCTLEIALDCLSSFTFFTLAARLPNLKTLTIKFRYLSAYPPLFSFDFRSWEMSVLSLQQLEWSGHTNPISGSMARLILEAMPNVQYLDAIPREDIVKSTRPPDLWPGLTMERTIDGPTLWVERIGTAVPWEGAD